MFLVLERGTMLKSQDIVVAAVLAVHPRTTWSFQELSEAACMSRSAAFRSVERLRASGLVVPGGFRVFDDRLANFLEHGVPYAFAVAPGRLARGVPTAYAAPPLNKHVSATTPLVWPHAEGTLRGETITPLSSSAPEAALKDPELHRVLSLIDALRIGRPRERIIASKLLKEMLKDARVVAEAG